MRTPWIDKLIQVRINRLTTFYDRISGCRVLVEPTGKHHEHGARYHVRIDLTVPGDEIVVSHQASEHGAQQDVAIETGSKALDVDPQRKHLAVAIREAFDVARRQLQDYVRRQNSTGRLDHARHAD